MQIIQGTKEDSKVFCLSIIVSVNNLLGFWYGIVNILKPTYIVTDVSEGGKLFDQSKGGSVR